MSKADAQRAFREANYARLKTAGGAAGSATPATPAKPKVVPVAPTRPTTAKKSSTPAGGALCGHRNMGNKTCSRPAGHPEKNHRYK